MSEKVALLAEGVDRNAGAVPTMERSPKSPSSRRAWIEISVMVSVFSMCSLVSLLAEGVDRNSSVSRGAT